VVSAKRYDPFWLTTPGDHVETRNGRPAIVPPTAEQKHDLSRVRVVGASRHGATHTPPPGVEYDTWVDDLAASLIARQAGIRVQEPPWANQPAVTLIPVTRPEIGRLHPKARPHGKLAIWPAMLGDNRAVTPWHPAFDPVQAEWRNPDGGGLARPLQPGTGTVTGTGGFIGDTYATALSRLRRSPERTALTHTGNPCGTRSRGLLHPAPTIVTGIALVGKESRRWRDSRNILGPAEHVTYQAADDWPLTLTALRAFANDVGRDTLAREAGVSPRTLRYLLNGRRPSVGTRSKISEYLLRKVTTFDVVFDQRLPPDSRIPHHAQQTRPVEPRCAGCGQTMTLSNPRQRYCGPACRQRAYRRRKAALLGRGAGVGRPRTRGAQGVSTTR
jgi:hypothetical protein